MQTISVKRGDTWTVNFAYTDSEGAPINLLGASCAMDLRGLYDETVLMSLSDVSGELTINGAIGEIDLLVPYADMEPLGLGTYRADMEVTYPNGVRSSSETFGVDIVEDITV